MGVEVPFTSNITLGQVSSLFMLELDAHGCAQNLLKYETLGAVGYSGFLLLLGTIKLAELSILCSRIVLMRQ